MSVSTVFLPVSSISVIRAERYNLIVYIHNWKHARDEKHGE